MKSLEYRHFKTRTERYKLGLAMSNRLLELKEIHKWSSHETDIAIRVLDENVPMVLHTVGMPPSLLGQSA